MALSHDSGEGSDVEISSYEQRQSASVSDATIYRNVDIFPTEEEISYFDNSKLTLQHYYISPMSFKEVSLSIFNIEYLSRVYTNTDFKLGMQYTYNYINRDFINAFYGMVILSID